MLGFPYCGEIHDKSGGHKPLKVFVIIRIPKDTLCEDASFEPSTITIGPGDQPVELRKKKVEKGI